jgi:DNA-binding beta-propeller fold protein YncE
MINKSTNNKKKKKDRRKMQNKLSVILFLALVLSLSLLATGCGGSKEAQQGIRYVWPELPDSPRVAYVKTFHGEKDFSTGLGGIVGNLTGGESSIWFDKPFDICTAGDGRFYITDLSEGVILYDTKKGKVESIGENSVISLKDPRAIAYAHGKLYIGVAGSKKIAVLDDEGKVVRAIGREGRFPNPVDIVCDTARRRVYIVDSKLSQVFAYSEDGDSLFTIGKRGVGDGEFNYPQSAAVDSSGNLFVVDGFNYRVEIFDSTGKYLRQFGSHGDGYGMFGRPKGIALDSHQNIYVLDGLHQNFQIFNNAGELLMFVGRYSSGNDGFTDPVSIVIDRSNTIYVTDYLNSRIQVFQLLKND